LLWGCYYGGGVCWGRCLHSVMFRGNQIPELRKLVLCNTKNEPLRKCDGAVAGLNLDVG